MVLRLYQEHQMLNVTQELSNKIAAGNHWLVYDGVNIVDAFNSRDAARATKGENKLKKWDGAEGFNLVNGNGHVEQDAEPDDSIQGVIDGAQAVGMNVAVIDENTDFSKLHLNLGGADKPLPREATDASEFAADKEAEVVVTDLKTKPIDPVKEKKPKAEVSHKSTVERPTQLVHTIANMLYDADPAVTRKEIIAACTEQGIAYYTILTQYQAWKAARGE